MMTAQEAIERLTKIVDFCSGGRGSASLNRKPLSWHDEEQRQINFSALDMAISALEKQVGKKPEKFDIIITAGEKIIVSSCAICKQPLLFITDAAKPVYCQRCGNQILWDGDAEDEDGK